MIVPESRKTIFFRERKTARKYITLDNYFQSQILKQLKNTIH